MRNRMLLLLDGLDEVASASRYACLNAINEFTGKIGVVGVAVCSRSEEYRALAAEGKLKLSAAVRLHSLTEAKVDEYLEAAGDAGLGVLRRLLKEDSVLRELSQNPLMLAVMTRAYEHLPAEALNQGNLDTPEKRREHILGTYVERLMHDDTASPRPYTEGSTQNFLAWLAGRLTEHSVSVFFIEQLQPSWLDGWRSRWLYFVLSRVLASALIAPLLMMVAPTNWLGPIGAVLALGMGVALADATMGMIRDARTDSRLGWFALVSARLVSYVSASGLLTAAGLLALDVTHRGGNIDDATKFFVWSAVIFGALGWTIRNIDRTPNNDIHTLEVMTLSLRGALRGGLYGVATMGVFVLAVRPLLLRGHALRFWDLVVVEVVALSVGATLGMFKTRIRETKNRPNEGILLSAKNAVFVTLALSAVMVATASSLDYSVFGGILRKDLLGCILIGVTVGFFYAGADIVNHYALRLILFFRHQTALRYANFLDYAARLTFMRKVGGGYIFLHPLIVDYFATHPGTAYATVPGAPIYPAQ